MKKFLFAVVIAQLCGQQLIAQESSVKILLNEEVRFRFEGQRLEFVNPGHHLLIGDSAGYNLDNSAGYNVFMGYRAGYKTTTGWDNVFIGDSAGYNNLGGAWNTAVGSWAGYGNTEGYYNSFYGLGSGIFNTTGNSNSYFGFQSGVFNTAGNLNSFFGFLAGYKNKGSKNVFLGAFAGKENLGDSNVFIGYNADRPGSNLLVIDNVPRPNPLIYGEFDNQILRFNAKRIETGFDENIFIGDSAGAHLEWGGHNVFLGFRAGMKHSGGSGNIYIGDSTGFSNKTGATNTYIGAWAGLYDSAGRANVFLGCVAGIYNTSGQRNVFVGHGSGYYNSSGTDNAFFGCSSGVSNRTGNNNTYIGRRAGENNQTGSGNIFLGYYAGANELGSNKLYIANSGTSEPLIGGDFTANEVYVNGKVGIGTSDPESSALLDISSTSQGFLPPRLTVLQQRMIENPATGLMVFNIDSLDLFIYTGSFWVSVLNCDDRDTILPWTCGDSITIHHLVSGGVAPVDKTVTYGSVTNIPGEPSKCWITSNLGADHQATVIDDNTEASAGWYWQFNRMQGYKHDGTTLTPGWTISSINENSDWLPEYDPCALELGNGWRLPTYDEWFNVDASGGWTNWNGPWNSGLKLQSAGYLSEGDGSSTAHGYYGYYWSIMQGSNEQGLTLHFDSNDYCGMNGFNKAAGISIRCIRDE
jgi:hypothetical protein